MATRGFAKFFIKVALSLQFLGYLRTLSLKFQKAASKIEDFLALPCWLSQGRKVCWKISQLQSKCCYNKHWFVDLHKHGVKRMHCLLSLKRATFYLI